MASVWKLCYLCPVDFVSNEYFCQLDSAIDYLYQFMHYNKEFKLSDICLVCYQASIPINTFYIKYENGLILFNDDNQIHVTALYPEKTAIDHAISRSNTPTQFNAPKQSNAPQQSSTIAQPKTTEKRSRHQHIYNRAKNMKPVVSTKKDNEVNEVIEQPIKVVDVSVKNVDNMHTQKRVFSSDKYSYQKIKNDIDEDRMDPDDINPCFVLKYDILKVLDSRGKIEFDNDDNIDQEYDDFMMLYQLYLEDIANDDDNNTDDVYIPHNYNYLSLEKQTEHAAKYNMTHEEFENKYIYKKQDKQQLLNSSVVYVDESDESDEEALEKYDEEVSELSLVKVKRIR